MSVRKICLITGSTRGIGKHLAETLSRNGYSVIITGKSDIRTNKGDNIHSVAENIRENGGDALGLKLDIRDEKMIKEVRERVISEFGKLDVLINNASALDWKPLEYTSVKKYDLINNINARGSFLMAKEFVPFMEEGSKIITHSPPIDPLSMKYYLENSGFKNRIAYMVSKLGMSLVASGLAQELSNRKIASNCIWPMTAIESAAMKDNPLIPDQFNNPKLWRRPEIISDMVLELLKEPDDFTNQFLLDEVYLREKGYENFEKYQCVPGFEPPKLLDLFSKRE